MGGAVLPARHHASGFLPIYATHFTTVEIDTTYYRIPTPKLGKGWFERTPPGFIFAAKFPGEITHKKLLVDCQRETDEFLGVMELLGEKLGPLLIQFPYLNQEAISGPDEFLSRLARYLERLPRTHRYAVEVRNKHWVTQPLLDLLRKHGVALALVDQVWMPTITQLAEKLDVLTADFTYIRWIGDRKGIEQKTKTWDKIIVNHERETQTWVRYVRQFLHRGEVVYAYYKNHYGGYGPGSIELFRNIWKET